MTHIANSSAIGGNSQNLTEVAGDPRDGTFGDIGCPLPIAVLVLDETIPGLLCLDIPYGMSIDWRCA
jgi:hypothetical protein